jgi:hypothetical protein
MRSLVGIGVTMLLAAGCGGATQPMVGGPSTDPLTVMAAAGNWTGNWNNVTYGSTGSSTASVTVDSANNKATFVLDLNGNVFGGTDPAAETFTGTYDDNSFTFSGPSNVFGLLTLTIKKDGTVTGSATPPRGAVTLTGTADKSKITVNYAIKNPPNADILGYITLTK